MITKELIDKINYYARKQRTEGLTEEEKIEQGKVRRIYLDAIKDQIRCSLENVKMTEEKENCHDDKCHCHKCQ